MPHLPLHIIDVRPLFKLQGTIGVSEIVPANIAFYPGCL